MPTTGASLFLRWGHLRLTPSMYQMPVIKAPQRGGPRSVPLSSLNSLPSVKGKGLAPSSAPFYLPLTTPRPGAGLPAACPEGRCDRFKGLPLELGRRPEQHLPSIHFSSYFTGSKSNGRMGRQTSTARALVRERPEAPENRANLPGSRSKRLSHLQPSPETSAVGYGSSGSTPSTLLLPGTTTL